MAYTFKNPFLSGIKTTYGPANNTAAMTAVLNSYTNAAGSPEIDHTRQVNQPELIVYGKTKPKATAAKIKKDNTLIYVAAFALLAFIIYKIAK